MAYVISCSRRDDHRLNRSGVSEYLTSIPHIRRSDLAGTVHFEYLNNDTGVSCWFDLLDRAGPDAGTIPKGSTEEALTVSLNLFRPHFFALEVMPLLETLCHALDLLISDTQCQAVAPEEVDTSLLIERWAVTNLAFTRYLGRRHAAPMVKPYLPHPEALNSW